MTLFGKIKDISQEHKDAVFGYIERNKTTNADIPHPIKYLSLLYYYEYDQWDASTHENLFSLKGNTITKGSMPRFGICCLSNVVNDGEHVWKFQINCGECDRFGGFDKALIGIWKTRYPNPNSLGQFYPDSCGYTYDVMSGWLSDPTNNKQHWTRSYNTKLTAKNNGIIEMRVNFKSLSLSYTIGDRTIHAFRIENTSYKVAIEMDAAGSKLKLLSYQKIYKPEKLSIEMFEFDKRKQRSHYDDEFESEEYEEEYSEHFDDESNTQSSEQESDDESESDID